jgi:hypothetical protein
MYPILSYINPVNFVTRTSRISNLILSFLYIYIVQIIHIFLYKIFTHIGSYFPCVLHLWTLSVSLI